MTLPTMVRLLLSSGQYSDTPAQHNHDADALFGYAQLRHVDVLAGTEANHSPGNNLLDALHLYGPRYGYRVLSKGRGDCWIAVRREFADVVAYGFREVIPPNGAPASQGGHSARGLFTAQLTPHDDAIGGDVFVDVTHWLTRRSDPTGAGNRRLNASIASWGRAAGAGSNLAFVLGDPNQDDARVDVFNGAPFVTCWDELGKHPVTHGRSTIDIVASYSHDKRVDAVSAEALTDADLPLYSDHFAARATYAVHERRS